MRRVMIGLVTAVALVVAPSLRADAAPSPITTLYSITCDGGPLEWGSPQRLPEPWSSTYQVPDVRSRGAGAFVARLQLVNDFGNRRFLERPTGVITADEGTRWMAAAVCVAVPNKMPVGEIVSTKVEGRDVFVFAYAYDPDSRVTVMVSATVDGVPRAPRFPASWPWAATAPWPTAATNRAVLVRIDALQPGEHQICLQARDGVGGKPLVGSSGGVDAASTIGCTRVVVK